MTWEEIKTELDRRQITQRRLAKRWHKTEAAVSRFFSGYLKSPGMREKTARLLNVNITEIPIPETCPTCQRPFGK